MAEEQEVHTRDGSNFLDIVDAVSSFHLQGADDVIVGRSGIPEESGFIHAPLGKIDGPRAGGGVAATTHGLARFVDRVDIRDKHPIGANIKRLLNATAIVCAGDSY